MRTTAARLAVCALEQLGVRFTFGIPGVHNIELYDELDHSESIRPVLVTHEMAAAFMANAVARTTGGIGVLAVVPAAGLTHAMSGIGEAFLDGIPMLVISGGVRTDLDKRYQLHEIDQHALMAPVTKASFRPLKHADVAPMIHRAHAIATSGEPGPVYVELPANLQLSAGEAGAPPGTPAPPEPPVAPAAALLAVGTRFGEIPTGSFGLRPPENLVHLDINPDVFNANYPTEEVPDCLRPDPQGSMRRFRGSRPSAAKGRPTYGLPLTYQPRTTSPDS